jgi:hypothetical protein
MSELFPEFLCQLHLWGHSNQYTWLGCHLWRWEFRAFLGIKAINV